MDIQVTVKPTFQSLGKAFSSMNVSSFLRDKINEISMGIERFAKQLSPVDTGRLRASIHVTPASMNLQAIIATGTNYAVFVHEGTKYMRGRPFMGTGATMESKYIEGEIKAKLEEEFVKAFKSL